MGQSKEERDKILADKIIAENVRTTEEMRQALQMERQGKRSEGIAKVNAKKADFINKTDTMIKNGMQGFDTFASAMSQVVKLGMEFVEAHEDKVFFSGKYLSMAEEWVRQGGNKLLDHVRGFPDDLKKKIKALEKVEFKICLQFTDDGKLDNASFEKPNVVLSDKSEPFPELSAALEQDTKGWLNANGYTMKDDGSNVIYKMKPDGTPGAVADKAALENIRDHGNPNFSSYLSNLWGRKFELMASNEVASHNQELPEKPSQKTPEPTPEEPSEEPAKGPK